MKDIAGGGVSFFAYYRLASGSLSLLALSSIVFLTRSPRALVVDRYPLATPPTSY